MTMSDALLTNRLTISLESPNRFIWSKALTACPLVSSTGSSLITYKRSSCVDLKWTKEIRSTEEHAGETDSFTVSMERVDGAYQGVPYFHRHWNRTSEAFSDLSTWRWFGQCLASSDNDEHFAVHSDWKSSDSSTEDSAGWKPSLGHYSCSSLLNGCLESRPNLPSSNSRD